LSKKISISQARSKARRCALQAIYQWQVAGQSIDEVEAQFLAEQDLSQTDVTYFSELVRCIPAHVAELDAHLTPFLDRPVAELDPVELAILRIGACELAYHPEVPFRVIINEAVELAKVFGAEQSHRYINGVMDKVARHLRRAELKMNTH
jgi:transcription antitermination protein NusB